MVAVKSEPNKVICKKCGARMRSEESWGGTNSFSAYSGSYTGSLCYRCGSWIEGERPENQFFRPIGTGKKATEQIKTIPDASMHDSSHLTRVVIEYWREVEDARLAGTYWNEIVKNIYEKTNFVVTPKAARECFNRIRAKATVYISE